MRPAEVDRTGPDSIDGGGGQVQRCGRLPRENLGRFEDDRDGRRRHDGDGDAEDHEDV